MPGDPDDDARVASFIEAYAAAHATSARTALGYALDAARTPEESARLAGRYEREIAVAADFLAAIDVPEERRAHVSRVRAALVFIESYRELPLLAWPRAVIDAVVAFEQAFVLFRQRHARMVERVIGRRTGTGGSAGVEYLDQTALRYRIFRDVWAVRTILVQERLLPPLEHAERYGFYDPGAGTAR